MDGDAQYHRGPVEILIDHCLPIGIEEDAILPLLTTKPCKPGAVGPVDDRGSQSCFALLEEGDRVVCSEGLRRNKADRARMVLSAASAA